MEDLGNNVTEAVDVVKGLVSGAVGWWTTKFGTSKRSKVLMFIAAFLAVAIVLSLLQAVFGG